MAKVHEHFVVIGFNPFTNKDPLKGENHSIAVWDEESKQWSLYIGENSTTSFGILDKYPSPEMIQKLPVTPKMWFKVEKSFTPEKHVIVDYVMNGLKQDLEKEETPWQ